MILWTLNNKNETSAFIIDDVPYFFHVEIPKREDPEDFKNSLDRYINFTNEDMKFESRFEDFTKFYFYNTTKTHFIRYTVKTANDFNTLVSKLSREITFSRKEGKTHKLNILNHRSQLSHRLKLFTELKVRYFEWFTAEKLENIRKSEKITDAINEYRLSYKKLIFQSKKPEAFKEVEGKVIEPSVLSFDIETYSSNHNAMPNMENPEHVIYMVSLVYQPGGGGKGDVKKYVIVNKDCRLIDDCEVICVKTEKDLLKKFEEMIKKLNPIVLTGYNIYGYDYPYLDYRMSMRRKWNNISLLKDYDVKLSTTTWKSSAYGVQNLSFLDMPGRISIDVMNVIKKDYKLEKYSLGYVSDYFLKRSKLDVSAKQMFETYEKCLFNPGDEETVDDFTRVTEYCIRDSDLVIELYNKLNIWITCLESSNIMSTDIIDILTRGQQIRCISMVYGLATEKKYILDVRDNTPIIDGYKGGYVGEPEPGVHDSVICLDFASLYPSIISAYNLCHTTFVKNQDKEVKKDDLVVNIELETLKKLEEDGGDGEGGGAFFSNLKFKKDSVDYRFVSSSTRRGIIPELVTRLVNERNEVRKKIKETNDPLQKIVLDKRQLALKVSANSLYGFLGAKNGVLPMIELAMTVTNLGMKLIKKVNSFILDTYEDSKIIYNDTDSVMFTVKGLKPKDVYQAGMNSEHDINEVFKNLPPIRMEFEKGMKMLCIKKKKYAYLKINKDGSYDPEPETRGIVLSRRDNIKYLRDTYLDVLKYILLNDGKLKGAVRMIVDACVKLFNDKVPVKDLVYIKGLGEYASNSTYYLKVYADRLAESGLVYKPGDRLEYLIVDVPKAKKKTDKMMDFAEYMKIKPRPSIDHKDYIEGGLKALDELILIGLGNKIKDPQPMYTPTRRNQISLYAVTKCISVIIEDYMRGGGKKTSAESSLPPTKEGAIKKIYSVYKDVIYN